ncbi:MAG: methyltransferase [Kiritimatiellae bacterium]|nr:methyltransferase [Kiritimatiellia bacterium]
MKTLLVGYKAQDLFEVDRRGTRHPVSWLDGDITCHTLDIYHCHAIENSSCGVKAVCSPHLPKGDWDLVKFKTGPKLMSGELSLDLLQEIHLLHPKRFELEFVGRERDRNDLLAKIKDDPDRVRDFSAVWPASVPGGQKLMLTSFPGCFCHRRVDDGGLALAEVVSRELSGKNPRAILDMGCGCGLVGFLVAASQKGDAPIRLVMVDSHTRAVEAAELNAEKLGIPAEVILSDNGTPAQMDGSFDVFVGNPPYYSDYRIADIFLETARRALKYGGVCYTVCKNADGLEPVQRRYFPEVEIIRRRGYAVLKSVKN